MKLVQENSLNQDTSSVLSIEKIDEKVIIIIENNDFVIDKENKGIQILSKSELSNLIGGLLHIQSKFRK